MSRDLAAGDAHNLMCEVFICPIYTALFLCVGTLYGYEICCDDSVRLALQYKTAKLHVHSLMRSTKLNKMCIIFTICG